MRKRDEIVLWPVYFDSTKTRKQGRKIPKKSCKSLPALYLIEKAIRNLDYSYKIIPNAAYPFFPQRQTGYIILKKVKPKYQLLKEISDNLKV